MEENNAARPLIALWAHPRSMSTAFERMMRERGDCECVHEPFIYNYYVARQMRVLPHFEVEDDRPIEFDDIVAMLRQRASTGPVFFKDMAYYVSEGLPQYPDLARQMRHVFLIRDPQRSIMSYYRLDPDVTLEEIGYEAQWKLYQWLADLAPSPPLILRAEDIQTHTREAMTETWRHMGLAFCEDAFAWRSDDVPPDWQQVSGWHETASTNQSIKIDQRSNQEVRTAFDAMASAAPKLRLFLDHHHPFYDALSASAWSPRAN